MAGLFDFVGLESGRDPANPADINGTIVATEDAMTQGYLETATSSPDVDVTAAAAAASSTLQESTYVKGDQLIETGGPQ